MPESPTARPETGYCCFKVCLNGEEHSSAGSEAFRRTALVLSQRKPSLSHERCVSST